MTSMNSIPKVLLASKDPNTDPLWSSVFESKTVEVIRETNFTNVFKSWWERIPDLVIFDVTSLDDDVFHLIEDLREHAVVPVLLLTTSSDINLILQVYEAGVDECICKPIHPAVFQAKLNAWLRRSWIIPVDMLDPIRVGNLRLIPSRQIISINNDEATVHLTKLETQLLYVLMSRLGHPFRHDELIHKVWGRWEDAAATAALKNIVYCLRKKIEADPLHPQVIINVSGVGYMYRV